MFCAGALQEVLYLPRVQGNRLSQMLSYQPAGSYEWNSISVQKASADLPLLFLPAFAFREKLQLEFYGKEFWEQASRARVKDKKAAVCT